jgi:hypothetical protein
MVKERVRNEEYNWFSNWHRKRLSDGCFMMDIDCVEIRFDGATGRVAGLFEIKSKNAQMNEIQRRTLLWMSRKLSVPAYMVKYHAGGFSNRQNYLDSSTKFEVWRIDRDMDYLGMLDEKAFIHLMENL